MKSKTILIAFQDDIWARSLSTFLHGVGYKVETAKVVSEMIRRVRNGNIDVVLLDDEIEGVKACDLVLLFKKINNKIQILVISSEEGLEAVKRLRGAGIFYQSMKPLDLDEIKSAVECAFEKIERENLKGGFRHELKRRKDKGVDYLVGDNSRSPLRRIVGRSRLERQYSLL
jgi:DNA-binding NtrC family response regulator